MKKYRVEFEFKINDPEISDGKYHKDFLDNNGEGFNFDDAERVACDLRLSEYSDNRNVDVIEMEDN